MTNDNSNQSADAVNQGGEDPVAIATDALQSIVEVHSMHCDHHINVSKHSYDLAGIAETALQEIAALSSIKDQQPQESLSTANTLAGFRGGFIATQRRNPTEQEIWNAAVRSGIDRTKDQQAQPVEPELCPACGGSGESTYLSDNGPDAHDIPCNCPHCNGGQTLADAYEGVCKLLEAETKRASVLSSDLYWKAHESMPDWRIPEDESYRDITELKTASIVAQGYKITGFVLRHGNNDRVCISEKAAVRWLYPKDMFNFMQCVEPFPAPPSSSQ